MERGELQFGLNVEQVVGMLAGTWMHLILVKREWPDDDELTALIDPNHGAIAS